jgi:putative spermidine/putrescine transport system permease protein
VSVAAETKPQVGGAREPRRLVGKPSSWITWGLLGFFLVILAGVVGSVLLNSLATRWLDTWLPQGYTVRWFSEAWREFALAQVLLVTFEVAAAVVVVSILIGVPAAYVMARRDFPGKRFVMVLFLLPVIMPTITYGVPLATLLYDVRLAGTLMGVIVANLVPAVPFAILVFTPFVEQIDPRTENAARMCGAGTRQIFTRILLPQLIPGIVAVSILTLVRTIAMFELTFLTAGTEQQTLVVKLFYAVSAAGFRLSQSIDAMAVIYMATNVVLLAAAFRYISPQRLVGRV